jgi:hypothetical protein
MVTVPKLFCFNWTGHTLIASFIYKAGPRAFSLKGHTLIARMLTLPMMN